MIELWLTTVISSSVVLTEIVTCCCIYEFQSNYEHNILNSNCFSVVSNPLTSQDMPTSEHALTTPVRWRRQINNGLEVFVNPQTDEKVGGIVQSSTFHPLLDCRCGFPNIIVFLISCAYFRIDFSH